MRTVASDFAAEMKRITAYVDLVVALFDMAKIPLSALRCKKTLADAIRDSHTRVRSLTLGDSLAFEGAFLSSCALFEEAVRDMIETCADRITTKKPAYMDLPEKMREAHLDGCGMILQNLDHDKFAHLTLTVVVNSLASCHCLPLPPAYSLIPEPLSSHTRNFRSGVLTETVGRLGIGGLWPKLGGQASLQTLFSVSTQADAQRFAVARLDSIMLKRNGTIHRGTGYIPPTGTEVKEAADFFAALIDALADVLDAYVTGL